jgi:phosphoribosylglycinamide formyltransferase-1
MLNVAVLCSKRAPGLNGLLARRNDSFDVSCIVTTHEDAVVEAPGIPVISHPIRAYDDRRTYDVMTLHVLRELGVDAVLLLGYLYVVTDVLLSRFPQRVFNIHDSDLTIKRPDGERKYVGLHSTRDAILGGERETRSTLHVVTEKLDGGPILSLSPPFPVAPWIHDAVAAGQRDIVKAYAYAQREWMMRSTWGEMAARVFAAQELVAA